MAVVVSTYGVRLGAFLLETAKNPVALMSCCGVPIDLAEEGPRFLFHRTVHSSGPLPDLFVETGLPLHSLKVRCLRLRKEDEKDAPCEWLVVTIVYVFSAELGKSARFEFSRNIIPERNLRTLEQQYREDFYMLSDQTGNFLSRNEFLVALSR